MLPSFKGAAKRLEVPSEGPSAIEPTSFINNDIVPLPPSRRTWGPASFVGFWTVANVNLSNWTAGSALISLGLNVPQSVAVIVIGNVMVALCVLLTGAPGAKWHIPFAVVNRSSWGLLGSFFVLANRCILNFTWHACQSYFGARCLRVVIGSIWPSFYKLDTSLAGGTLDTSTIVAFVLFAAVQMPLIWIKPEYYRKPFLVSSILISITCVILLIWAMVRAGGAGALVHDASAVSGVTALHGSDYHWAMTYAVTTVLGSICAGMLNQSDYTRYAVKPMDPVWSQLITIPVGRILCSFIGITVTSCAAQWWPEAGLLWMPPDMLQQLQMTSGNATRAGVFFAALMFTLSQWCMNTADNATPGGIDLASMFPKYINIRRGAYITALVSYIIQPWQLLNGSSVYLSVMGSYSVFIAPLTGLMVSDYFLVRQRKYRLSHLYMPTKESIYWYRSGWNWRAPVAWACGVFPIFPGFIHYVSSGGLSSYNAGAIHLFQMCWPLGFAITLTVFAGISYFYPPVGIGETDDEDIYGTFTERPLRTDDENISGNGSLDFGNADAEKKGSPVAEVSIAELNRG